MHTFKHMHTRVHKYNSNYAITHRVIEFLISCNKENEKYFDILAGQHSKGVDLVNLSDISYITLSTSEETNTIMGTAAQKFYVPCLGL